MQSLAGMLALACVASTAALAIHSRQAPATPPGTSSPQPALTPGRAVITGRVVEAGTQIGVGDARVTLSGPALGTSLAVFTDGTLGGSRVAAADSDGRFIFRGLPPGSYTLNATASGYVTAAYGETRPMPVRRTLDLVRRITVAEDGRASVTIQLWKTGGIGGHVLDDRGEPLVGAPVTVYARMTDWGGPFMSLAASAMTDDRGAYHVDVTPGDYVVGVPSATTSLPMSAVGEFLHAQTEGGAAMNAFMNRMTASGALLPRGIGTRVGDLLVQQIGTSNTPSVPPMLSIDGALHYYPSAWHPAAVRPNAATLVSVGSGEEKSGIDIRVHLARLNRVAGQVTGPEGPAGSLRLRLVAEDPAVWRASPATLIDTPNAVTDVNGRFIFLGVPPGSYTLQGMRSPMQPDDPTLWIAQPLEIGDEDISGLTVALQTGAVVSGRVEVTAGSRAAESLGNLSVSPRPLPGSRASLFTGVYNTRVNGDRTFSTRQIPPGPYMMSVLNVPAGYIVKSVTWKGVDVMDRPFDVTASGVSDVIVTLTSEVSTLMGSVRDSSGRPFEMATVAIFPTERALWRLPGMASRRVQTVAPGPDGRYSVRGLPAGDYFVVAADWPTADFSDGNVLSKLIPGAARVSIPDDGASVTVDLRLMVVR